MTETFADFVVRMGAVDKEKELSFGRSHCGNSRAIFNFDGYRCHLESYGYRTIPEGNRSQSTPAQMLWVAAANPHDEWLIADWIKGRFNAEKLALKYGGRACPDEYHEDDMNAWYLRFTGDGAFEKMLRVIWDHKNKLLPESTFPWKEKEE